MIRHEMNERLDCDRIHTKTASDRLFSAGVSLYSDETLARHMLFVLMKTLARNKEKLKQDKKREI